MIKNIFRADSRGHFDYGWLKTYHSFSFSNYFDSSRVHFGALRVVNDDFIQAGTGFDTHPHENMEIITIILTGSIKHRDSTGTEEILTENEVQIMSAGRGVRHSEFNPSDEEDLTLFQIWILPEQKNIDPRYDQKKFNPADRKNKFHLLVSPKNSTDHLFINQQAFLSRADFDAGTEINYEPYNSLNGTFIMVISGNAVIDGEELNPRDSISVGRSNCIPIKADTDVELLIIEIPLN
ncbi:MAG: pirin family protein [Candidatus Kapabacteria bacterium]|nr:pirin family protein [Candidatus Kapabacteria bacterium]